jgi:alkylated DNA repair dioxygenase AlkB
MASSSRKSARETRVPPEGLSYTPDFITIEEERDLVANIEKLPFHEVRMHGVVARRTVIHFGWDYDYSGWKIHPVDPPPPFLQPLVARCTEAAGVEKGVLEQMLVARYPPDAAIGWHRDAPMFGSPVVGVSLLAECVMKFRRKLDDGSFEVYKHPLQPRSLYILDGDARSKWQHTISRTPELRYSITLRTVRKRT